MHAALVGGIVDVSGLPREKRCVDAGFLRELYVGRLVGRCDPRGPGLGGLIVVGDLDLSHADVTVAVRTERCRFEAIHLSYARTRSVGLLSSSIVQLDAEGARIDGTLVVAGATINDPSQAIRLVRAEVSGSVDLQGVTCSGPIVASGIRVGGQLSLINASLLHTSDEPALDLNGASVTGSVRLSDGFTSAGPIQAIHADIGGQLSLHASYLSYGGPRALVLDDATIPGGVFATGGFTCAGQIQAIDAHIGRPFAMVGATLTYAGDGAALILDAAHVDGAVMLADGFSSIGPISAAGARIDGQLAMRAATLSYHGHDETLNLSSATITGSVVLTDGFTCAGPINLSYAHLTGPLDLGGATLTDDERALCLDAADISGDVLLGPGFQCAGQIRATDTRISGQLRLNGATLNHTSSSAAIDVSGARIEGDLVLDDGFTSASLIIATGASVGGALNDRPEVWPDDSVLEGLSYRFPAGVGAGPWSAASRTNWLDRMAYSSQAYRFLADRYRERGMPDAADAIVVAMRRRERTQFTGRLRRLRRGLDGLFEHTVGYGYRPWRTVVIAGGAVLATASLLMFNTVQDDLVAAGPVPSTYWTANGQLVDDRPPGGVAVATAPVAEGATDDRTATRFQPALYAVDTVIPLVDLDQRSTWKPDTTETTGWLLGVYLTVMRLAGWAFAVVITFAVARLFQTRHG